VPRPAGCSRRMQAARNRAPKSLKAAVGPWNSSSTKSPRSRSGTSGAGKVNASASIAGSSLSRRSPAKKGASIASAESGRVAPRGVPPGGSLAGTKSPPSGAVPPSKASASGSSVAPLRVLMTFMRPASPRGRPPGRSTASQSMPAARKACSIARAIRSARSRVHQAKMLGPPAGDARPQRPCLERGGLHRSESPHQRRPQRLHQHVAQPRADAVQVVPEAPGEHQGQVGALLDEPRQLEGPLQHRPRGAGLEDLVRMHQHAGEPVGDRDGDETVVRREREASEEHRAHVVAVLGATGRGLAGERAPVEHVHRHRPVEQRARRHQGRDARGRRAAHPRAERDALLDPQGEAMGEPQPVPERQQRPSSGVQLRLQRQSAHHALDP
jgi:hypothetical protein